MAAPAAVLLPLPHNWVTGVRRERRWATDVLPARDGSEQRVQLATRPAERVTYRVTAATPEDAGALLAPVWASPGLRCLAPRWEDAVVLAADAAAGALALALDADPDGDATLRAFTPGGRAVLWRPDAAPEVVTLGAGAVAPAQLALAAPGLGAAWRAGAAVAPLVLARLVSPTALDRRFGATGALADAELVLDAEPDVAGLDPLDPLAAAQSPVVAALAIETHSAFDVVSAYTGVQLRLRAVARDAAGARVPAPGAIAWAVDLPTFARVYATGAPGEAAFESTNATGPNTVVTVTATDPASGRAATFAVLTARASWAG